jgi:serine phosphatase RsbU (regulator of sigma subunit)
LLDRDGEVRERLESTGIPLGLFAGRGFSSSPTLSLRRDETVVLLTDGITEIGEFDGKAFGAEGMLEFVKNHRHDSASHIVQGLYRAARSVEAKRPQTDDMTVVICKVEGGGP